MSENAIDSTDISKLVADAAKLKGAHKPNRLSGKQKTDGTN
jgi:hypothetical protein